MWVNLYAATFKQYKIIKFKVSCKYITWFTRNVRLCQETKNLQLIS